MNFTFLTDRTPKITGTIREIVFFAATATPFDREDWLALSLLLNSLDDRRFDLVFFATRIETRYLSSRGAKDYFLV